MTNVTGSLDLNGRVADTIRRYSLFREARCVLVGVSGGVDSVALLAVLRELAARGDAATQHAPAWRVVVAHLNHGIRVTADGDARFVWELCEAWRVECILGSADVPAEAKRTGESIEAAARRVRYEFLAATAERAGAQTVAVAHHADDNAETVLHRVLRGTGLAGLAGIPVERALGSVRLVRPMLHCRRTEIEQFLTARGLPWRVDETNHNLDYRRNFIRHELLPLIRERLNPRAEEALLRLAEQANTASEFLRAEAERTLEAAMARSTGVPPVSRMGFQPMQTLSTGGTPLLRPDQHGRDAHATHGRDARATLLAFSAAVLAAVHPAVRSEAIRLFFERAGLPARDLSAAIVAQACELVCNPTTKPVAVNLPQNWHLRRRHGVVWLQPPVAPPHGRGGL